MRTLARLACFFGLAVSMPACSLIFDGAGYRSGSGTDAGPTPVDAPGGDCDDSADCDTGFYCPIDTCVPGCESTDDCDVDEACDVPTNTCVPATTCDTDAECGPGEFCPSDLGVCVSCDEDLDGWAPMDAPPRCTALPAIIGAGDCEPQNAPVHPFALPDCDPDTHETCDSGAGALDDNVFEVGLVGLASTTVMPKPDSLSVHVLDVFPDGAMVLILFRGTGNVPMYSVARLGAGAPVVSDPVAWPDWSVLPAGLTTIASSAFSSVPNPNTTAGGVFVSSLEVIEDGAGTVAGLSQYRGFVDRTGAFSTAAADFRRPIVVALVDPIMVHAAAATSDAVVGGAPSGATLGAVVTVDDGSSIGAQFGIFGIDNEEARYIALPAGSVLSDVAFGLNGDTGVAFAGGGRSTITHWNGRTSTNAGFLGYDSMSSSRSAFASSVDGSDTLGFGASATGASRLTFNHLRCDPSGACTRTTSSSTVPGFEAGGGDPLLTADVLGGGQSFFVAGRSAGAGRGGLAAAVIDFRTSPSTPTVDGLVLPVDEARNAVDLDVDVLAQMPAAGVFTVEVGFAASRTDRVTYGAFRVCAAD